jgi:hypothetical protein
VAGSSLHARERRTRPSVCAHGACR